MQPMHNAPESKTTQPISSGPVEITPGALRDIKGQIAALALPEFIRLPKPGEHCKYSGLTRSVLSRLAAEGKIRAVSLRDRGKLRGCKLINLASLLEYLRQLEAEQNETAKTAP